MTGLVYVEQETLNMLLCVHIYISTVIVCDPDVRAVDKGLFA